MIGVFKYGDIVRMHHDDSGTWFDEAKIIYVYKDGDLEVERIGGVESGKPDIWPALQCELAPAVKKQKVQPKVKTAKWPWTVIIPCILLIIIIVATGNMDAADFHSMG